MLCLRTVVLLYFSFSLVLVELYEENDKPNNALEYPFLLHVVLTDIYSESNYQSLLNFLYLVCSIVVISQLLLF